MVTRGRRDLESLGSVEHARVGSWSARAWKSRAQMKSPSPLIVAVGSRSNPTVLIELRIGKEVLARFEGFPDKKLEALRRTSALYSKLESMITALQNWKFDLPLAELLDKVDHYFNKIKGEIDALEQTKDEEIKKFMSHNIEFDFQVLVRIKEAMLDVSSNCMELAMKGRREVKLIENEGSNTKAEAQKKGCIKMQWRAFQLAFRVYKFAGGHDDRTDMQSKELADEIETGPQLP